MHNITSNIGIAQVLKPQKITSAALDSGNIDMLGAETLAAVVLVGKIDDALGAGVHVTLKIEHADDNGLGAPTAYTACTDADVLNATDLTAGAFAVINATDKDERRYVIDYRGGKRFVKITATPAGLTTGGEIAMLALKANFGQKPVSNN